MYVTTNNIFYKPQMIYYIKNSKFIVLNPGETLTITKDQPLIIDGRLSIKNSTNINSASFCLAKITIEPDAKIILKKGSKLILKDLIIQGAIENFEFEEDGTVLYNEMCMFITNKIIDENRKQPFFLSEIDHKNFVKLEKSKKLRPKNTGLDSGCPQF
ncbi:MAG: hypothetical protein ABIF12_02685 [bacterium]